MIFQHNLKIIVNANYRGFCATMQYFPNLLSEKFLIAVFLTLNQVNQSSEKDSYNLLAILVFILKHVY